VNALTLKTLFKLSNVGLFSRLSFSSVATLLLVFLLCLSSKIAFAQDFSNGNEHVQAKIIADRDFFSPPHSFEANVGRIGVFFKIEPGWHLYWKNSGDAGLPTRINWTLPQDWSLGEAQWPVPKTFLEGGNIYTLGYKNEVLLFANVFAPPTEQISSQKVVFSAAVEFLVCKDICIPGVANLKRTFDYSATEVPGPSADYEKFESFAAETPRDSSALADNGLSVRSTLLLPTKQNKKAVAGVLISGVKDFNLLQLAAQVQLYPELHPQLQLGRPVATKVADGLLLTLPLKPLSATETLTGTLRGVLAVAPSLSSQNKPIAVNWEIPLDRNIEPDLVQRLSGDKQDLTYLLVSESAGKSKTVSSLPLSVTEFLVALLFSLIAGIILNFMPCVLPVVAIKLMGFVDKKDRPKREVLIGDLFYTLGILSTFLVFAIIVSTLRAAGVSLGWGFQFQEPIFVLSLTFIVFIFSLGFFDLYCFSIPGVQGLNKEVSRLRHPLLRQFFDGVLATLLATPCTGPFLGFVLAIAFVHPTWVMISIFLTIGLGLALPYVYLSTHPKLLRFLPNPGPWMQRFKEFMGILLLATVCWLLSVLESLTGEVVWTLSLLLAVFFYFWIRKSYCRSSTRQRKFICDILLVGALAVMFIYSWPKLVTENSPRNASNTNSEITWQTFSPKIFENAKRLNAPALLVFTADWCITCKVNEALVVESDEVVTAIHELGILAVKADWTRRDETITQTLQRFGSSGVPLYVVLPKNGGEPIVLPVILTKGILLDALRKAAN